MELPGCMLAGNLDGDRDVDQQDLNLWVGLWHGDTISNDMDNDGAITVLDLQAVQLQFGACR